MNKVQTYPISCPSCGTPQEVDLYQAVNVAESPELKQALMENRLNRVKCCDCEAEFRVDMPLLYSDPAHHVLIHWIPLSGALTAEQVIEEFDASLEEMGDILPEGVSAPQVRLVFTRVELVELLFVLESGLNERVVEYVKYTIYTRNPEKIPAQQFRLLLNVQDSTDEELCFVTQNVETHELGIVLRYGRPSYESLCELYAESPEEFKEMFPGPCISARQFLIEEGAE